MDHDYFPIPVEFLVELGDCCVFGNVNDLYGVLGYALVHFLELLYLCLQQKPEPEIKHDQQETDHENAVELDVEGCLGATFQVFPRFHFLVLVLHLQSQPVKFLRVIFGVAESGGRKDDGAEVVVQALPGNVNTDRDNGHRGHHKHQHREQLDHVEVKVDGW